MSWFSNHPSIYFENARIADPVQGQVHGSLRLAHGYITGVNVAPQRGDVHFDLDNALVLPGLINAHDHLELNNFPRLKFRPCYPNARIWSQEVNARLDTDPAILAARAVPLGDRLFLGGLKNLLAGATTVAHHNPFYPPLRRNFPVRVVSRYGWAHSLYLSPNVAALYRRTPRRMPWLIHLAEGTDDEASGELPILEAAGALQANTVLIHGVGLTERQRAETIQRGAALVWCPRSNFFLLEATAKVSQFADAHQLALGTDSRLTGDRDLLDELRTARETAQISDAKLLCAVTNDAAKILRLRDVGSIVRGMRADLVILPKTYESVHDVLGQIRRADLRAVIFNGTVRIADPDFTPLLHNSVRVRLDTRDKIIAPELAERHTQNAVHESGFEVED